MGSVPRSAWSGGLGVEVCMDRWVMYLGLHGQVGSVPRSAWSGELGAEVCMVRWVRC